MSRRAEWLTPVHVAIPYVERRGHALVEQRDEHRNRKGLGYRILANHHLRGRQRRDHSRVVRHAPPGVAGRWIKGVNLVARRDEHGVLDDDGRPHRLDVARPELRPTRTAERDDRFRLDRNVDALVIHRASGRRHVIERGDPFLHDGKKRKRDREDFLFGFGAQTDAADGDLSEEKDRKYGGADPSRHYSLWDNTAVRGPPDHPRPGLWLAVHPTHRSTAA